MGSVGKGQYESFPPLTAEKICGTIVTETNWKGAFAMLKQLVEQNRTCRGFDESRKITKEELLELVDLTRYVASAANLQPLKFAILWEQEKVEAFLPLTKWGGALPQLGLPRQGEHPTAFIVICHDTTVSPDSGMSMIELGAMAQTMLLGAVERGLAGCMILSFKADGVKEQLGLAEHLVPKLVIGLGKSKETAKIVPVGADGSMKYYRDENDVHYVPKRDLKDIVIG
jgi:nitroreductase